ncbi:MAG: hypothetical protein AB1410_10440 [Acidobacteriota bacterium]
MYELVHGLAIRLYNQCYIHAFAFGKLSIEKKKWYCAHTKRSKEDLLKMYCKLLEKNPEGLNYLREYKLT